jgi:hypothetical protein
MGHIFHPLCDRSVIIEHGWNRKLRGRKRIKLWSPDTTAIFPPRVPHRHNWGMNLVFLVENPSTSDVSRAMAGSTLKHHLISVLAGPNSASWNVGVFAVMWTWKRTEGGIRWRCLVALLSAGDCRTSDIAKPFLEHPQYIVLELLLKDQPGGVCNGMNVVVYKRVLKQKSGDKSHREFSWFDTSTEYWFIKWRWTIGTRNM